MSLSKVQAASFKGIPFLVDNTNTEGGRKLVVHEYPNTNERFVEDMGELQETFTINGFVTGIDYDQKRDALIAALKDPGRGELIHPFFGEVTCVAKPYSLSESFQEFGVAKFTMTFDKSDASTYPSVSSDNTSLINLQSNSLNGLMNTDIASIFAVTQKYPGNFLSAKNIITAVSTALGVNASSVLKVASDISSFNSQLVSFVKKINSNIQHPANLGADFENLFGAYSLIGLNPKDQFDLLAGLFSYGSGEAPVPQTTVQRVEREKNRQVVNSAVNIFALSNAYNTVPFLTYTTEADVQNVQNQLQEQFTYVMSNNNASDDTVQAIKDLQVQVVKFLEVQLVNAFKISTVKTNQISMTLLCFNYYGSVDNTNALLSLNKTIDASFVEGQVEILTQ